MIKQPGLIDKQGAGRLRNAALEIRHDAASLAGMADELDELLGDLLASDADALRFLESARSDLLMEAARVSVHVAGLIHLHDWLGSLSSHAEK